MSLSALPRKKRTRTVSQEQAKDYGKKECDKINVPLTLTLTLTTDRMSVASAMIIQALEIQFISRSLSIMFISNSQ